MLLEEDWEQVKFLRDSAAKKAQEPTPRITILQATYAIDTTDNGELKLNMQGVGSFEAELRMEWFRVELLYGIVTDSITTLAIDELAIVADRTKHSSLASSIFSPSFLN